MTRTMWPAERCIPVIALLFGLSSPVLGSETVPGLSDERAAYADTLMSQGVLVEGRLLSHLSHVCNLDLGGEVFPVLDIRELVPGATTPRGLARIAILNKEQAVVAVFEYGSARPLFCEGNRLFLHGDLAIDNIGPSGNVVEFAGPNTAPAVTQIDPNDFPAPEIGSSGFAVQ